MERLDGGSAVPQTYRGGIVALGNFDGFHRGHQAVVGRAVERARAEGRPALVATFDPHPMRFFKPDSPWFRLTTMAQRARLFAAGGIDAMFVFPFDAAFAQVSATEFVADWLIGRLGAAGVVTGEDFTFGKGRTGDPQSMRRYGDEFGFSVSVAPAVENAGGKISSSAAREALHYGRPETAAAILGRPFAIEGVVQKGRQLGRKLGFPTANVPLADYVAPTFGVYATRTRLADGRELPGVANVGVNPTTGEVEPRLEVWLFDFDEDIYGETIETDLVAFLRPEEKFPSIEAMVDQIRIDARRARDMLAAW